MTEVAFLRKNAEQWKQFEKSIHAENYPNPDELAALYIRLTDDLSYARTFFPKSKTTRYLNQLTSIAHQKIYRNKKEDQNRFILFWKTEVPTAMAQSQRTLLYAFLIFFITAALGALSAAYESDFVRVILGDTYVNMTIENIKNGDPMGVYKTMSETPMFLAITFNNIRVAYIAFAAGLLFSVGTGAMLFENGIMLGAFQYFFYQYGVLQQSLLTIWIHGTLEISAIILAGSAGLTLGNSFLFPGTYPRGYSFRQGARRGLKIVIGITPIFIIAGFLEGFVTRHTEMPMFVSLFIIVASLTFIVWYFVIYPRRFITN